jgi:hypothetical protein
MHCSVRLLLVLVLVAVASATRPGWVRTPAGDRPASCVHAIDSELEYVVHHDDDSISSMKRV